MISFTIDGPTAGTFRHIADNAENMRQAIRQTFFFIGRDLKKKTSDDILDKKGKTGRVYIVRSKSGRRRRHQSSAPGETHANLSGDLRKSLGWEVHGTNSLEFGYGVTRETTDYARRIELGDDFGPLKGPGGRIKARPSIQNNIKNVSFETFYEKALEKLVGK